MLLSLLSLTEKLFLYPFVFLICSDGRIHRGHGLMEHYGIIIGAKNYFITSKFAGGRISLSYDSLVISKSGVLTIAKKKCIGKLWASS